LLDASDACHLPGSRARANTARGVGYNIIFVNGSVAVMIGSVAADIIRRRSARHAAVLLDASDARHLPGSRARANTARGVG
jgi:hypothetical protein